MKKTLVLLAAALAPWLAMPAWSQEAGVYAGASLGQAEHRDACEGANISCDEKDGAWKIFGGYQFNRHLAVELGYANLGESRASAVSGAITVNATFEVTAWELVGVGSLPLTERFSLFGKFGLYRAEVELGGSGSVGAITVPISADESNTDITFGVGIRYDITRNLGIRAEWQRYPDVGGDDTGESDIDLLSLGVLFRF